MDDSHASPAADAYASERGTSRTAVRADLPTWGTELLQILRARRGVLLATAIGLSLLGVLITLAAPGTLPPEPLVGGAVGLASWLLATAVAVAVDAGDAHVRGPRHVRSTGAVLAGWVAPPGGPQALGSFVRDLNRAYAAHGGQHVWLVPTTDAAIDVVETGGALATGLCQLGRRVLVLDLVSPAAGPGVSEVLRGTHSLGEVVHFDPELLLARVGAGSEPDAALQQVGAIIERAPGDVDVLLVILPAVDRPGVLAAVTGAAETFLLARAGTTGRVELLAGLEALESAGSEVSVVLIDHDAPVVPLAPKGSSPAPAQPDGPPDAPDAPASDAAADADVDHADRHAPFRRPDDEPAPEPALAAPQPSTPEPGPAPQPEPSYDAEPRPVPAATHHATGADALIEVDAAPAAGDRFRTAVALEALAQDHWTPEGAEDPAGRR